MIPVRAFGAAFAAAALLLSAGCKNQAGASADANNSSAAALPQAVEGQVAVTITGAQGSHVFKVELASTHDEQERGLMFRTDIPQDGGMLFAPYPGDGGPPREATFWMKNTPSPLDIIFIRPDGIIARIAENTVPFSEDVVPSGEPVSAVLEINGGRAGELGIAAGDKVSWPKTGK